MVGTVKDFKAAGINSPVLVGGAALTQNFTSNKIQPEYDGLVVYAKDAMHGLDLVNHLVNKAPGKRESFIKKYQEDFKPGQTDTKLSATKKAPAKLKEKTISYDFESKKLAKKHYQVQCVEADLNTLWPYINRQMLYGHHLGLKGNARKLLDEKKTKSMK
eukprot:COSAG01_NODE_25552_length_741_cov_0.912773_1_plen_159_part_10